jgi:hypothetical protein
MDTPTEVHGNSSWSCDMNHSTITLELFPKNRSKAKNLGLVMALLQETARQHGCFLNPIDAGEGGSDGSTHS